MARHFVAASGDYIDVGTNVRGTDLIGILAMCWLKVDSTGAEHKAMARWGTGVTEQWLLTVSAAAHVEFHILDSSLAGEQATGTTTLSTGTWYHAAGMFDGNNLSVWVNGIREARVVVGRGMNDSVAGTNTFIGKAADGNPFDGSIAEASLLLVNTAITTEAGMGRVITAAANGAAPQELEGMYSTENIGYWPLLGDSPEPDYGGQRTFGGVASPGTLHGTTYANHPGVASILSFGRSRENASGSGLG